MDCEEKQVRGHYMFWVLIFVLILMCIFVPDISNHKIGFGNIIMTAIVAYPIGLLCGAAGCSAVGSLYSCVFIWIVTGIGTGDAGTGFVYMILFVIICAIGEAQANNSICDRVTELQKNQNYHRRRHYRRRRRY